MSQKNENEQSQPKQSRTFIAPHKGGRVLVAAVIVIIGLIAAIQLLPKGERINSNGYQVVYTAGGATYFGKLQNTSGNYLVLKQPYTAQDVKQTEKSGSQSQTTLLKVSQQAYGPEDVISIKSDQVLFWQNLRNDSKVSQAIDAKQ